jgi:hypothetical protein
MGAASRAQMHPGAVIMAEPRSLTCTDVYNQATFLLVRSVRIEGISPPQTTAKTRTSSSSAMRLQTCPGWPRGTPVMESSSVSVRQRTKEHRN